MKADDTENTVEYFIGDNTYEIPKEVPFEDWKRILRMEIPYHCKTIPRNEWTKEDYEEDTNHMCRMTLIYMLEDQGEENWDEDWMKLYEVARRGINLSKVSGSLYDLV